MAGQLQIFSDLRKRRNIDVYVTIVVAVSVAVLSLLELVPPSRVTSLTLAILAILAFNSLATREAIQNQSDERCVPFTSEFPPDLVKRREASNDVLLVGVSLSRTIESSYDPFRKNLRNGAKLRIVLTDPDASDAAIDARCQYSRPTMDEVRDEIRGSLKKLARLKESGNLEVRTTKAALKFGVNYIDVSRPSAYLHVQLYSFRIEDESRPMFELTHANDQWFECFASQIEELWNDADVCDLARYRSGAIGGA